MSDFLSYLRFYPAETLSDERFCSWSLPARGAWLTLVLYAWREGSVPADQGALEKLLHVDGDAMATLWREIGDRFMEHPERPGRLTSPRLETEREKALEAVNNYRIAGKLGASARWRRHGDAMATLKRSDGSYPQPQPQPILSPPQAADHPKKSKGGGDPRHPALVERLVKSFEEVRRSKYGFHKRDAKAASEIINLSGGDMAEADRRWRLGLGEIGFRRSDTIHDLSQKWNAYSTGAGAGSPNIRRGMATPSEDWTSPEASKL